MELSGDLSDFALTDILQILALSRKSGILSLESGGMTGRIVIQRGRITHASVNPGPAFTDRLVYEGKISPAGLKRLSEIGASGGGWTLGSLLLESGVLVPGDLDDMARRHIQEVVGILVRLEKGRFGIDLNQVGSLNPLEEVGVSEGLDIGEVLLGAAKDLDEDSKEESAIGLNGHAHLQGPVAGQAWSHLAGQAPQRGEEHKPRAAVTHQSSPEPPLVAASEKSRSPVRTPAAQQTAERQVTRALGSGAAPTSGISTEAAPPTQPDRLAESQMARESQRAHLLCSLLAELRSHSFEAEVSLLIMRYASEVAARGVLFVVKEHEVCGLGQFGVGVEGRGKSPDERVREIHIPIGAKTIFDDVIRFGQPYIGGMPENYWHAEMLKKIGGNGMPLSVFALPLVCNDQPIFVFYGDNYPGRSELSGLDELVALVNQASIVLEKIVLERMLEEIRHSR